MSAAMEHQTAARGQASPDDGAAVAGRLLAAMRDAEPEFMALGAALRDADDGTRRAAARLETAAEAARADAGGLLGRDQSFLHRPLAELGRVRTLVEAGLASLERIRGGFTALDGAAGILHAIASTLKIIAVNTLIQAGRILHGDERVRVFAVEVKDLAARVEGIQVDLVGSVERVLHVLTRAENETRDRLAQLSLLADRERGDVTRAAAELGTLLAESERLLGTARRRAADAARGAGEIVVGVQFYDIARQQVEHVAAALGGPPSRTLVRLQAAQLRRVVDELAAVGPRLGAAFAGIRAAAAEIGASTQKSRQQGLSTHYDRLAGGLASLRRLGERQRAVLDGAARTISELGSAAAALVGSADEMGRIAAELRLKALNAVLMSGRLGDRGRAFGVLAREVQALAAEAVGESERVAASVRTVAARASGNTITAAAAEYGDGGAFAGLDQVEADLGAARDRAGRDGHETTEVAARVAAVADAVENRLAFLPRLAERLENGLRELADLHDSLPPEAGDDGELAAVYARYTMERERQVHQEIAASAQSAANARSAAGADSAASARPAAAAPVAPAADDGLGDNVELF